MAYLGRYASSSENLRRVLLRRARRRITGSPDAVQQAAVLIDALLARYRDFGLLDDAAYAVARVQSLHRRGEFATRIRARLAAKGVESSVAAEAVQTLRDETADPDLAAACAFARRRRLGPYRRAAAEPARELGIFARAGFARRIAERVLACADIDASRRLPAPSPIEESAHARRRSPSSAGSEAAGIAGGVIISTGAGSRMVIPCLSKAILTRRLKARPTANCLDGRVRMRISNTTENSSKAVDAEILERVEDRLPQALVLGQFGAGLTQDLDHPVDVLAIGNRDPGDEKGELARHVLQRGDLAERDRMHRAAWSRRRIVRTEIASTTPA